MGGFNITFLTQVLQKDIMGDNVRSNAEILFCTVKGIDQEIKSTIVEVSRQEGRERFIGAGLAKDVGNAVECGGSMVGHAGGGVEGDDSDNETLGLGGLGV